MNRCFLFGAGEFFGLSEAPCPGDITIAADGGYTHMKTLGLVPDFLVGDFDSLSDIPSGIPILRSPSRKDDTDMLLACKKGLSLGCTEFFLFGASGGRGDHTLANLQLLHFLAGQGARGFLEGQRFVTTVIQNASLSFPSGFNGLVSVFCFSGEANGVWERGLSYSLNNAILRFDTPLGVSNAFTGEPATISVKDGFLTVMWERQTIKKG